MLRLFPYITLGLLVYILLVYMQNYDPDALNNLIIRLDVFGITSLSRGEHERNDKIMRLEYDAYGRPIGTLEKQVLLNRTVFIGASAQMVEYALGPPKQVVFRNNNLYYVYFLANDKRPTVFEFACARPDASGQCSSGENYKEIFGLSKAYKKSTIDLMNIDEEAMPAR